MLDEELSAWLRLQLTPGVGDVTARKLLATFGLPQCLFEQSETALAGCATEKQAKALLQVPAGLQELVSTTLEWLHHAPQQRHVLTLGDPLYPCALLETNDPPLLLYVLGDIRHLQNGWESSACTRLAVVGSRNPSAQGAENAKQFASALTQAGLTIVSGLALGIDGAAHQGALDGAQPDQLATIAVVGTGLDRVYPKAHRDLAHRIAERGLIVSEYPLGTPPVAANFPKRNRIISGLSQSTLVVEAALQSGSLITARMAIDQGKDVFAIPGSIHATRSRGCHALIKQGAKLVESAQDVLEEFSLPSCPIAPAPQSANIYESGSPLADNAIVHALGFEPVGLDILQARTGLDTARLQAGLLELELEGHIVRLPGGLFQRVARA